MAKLAQIIASAFTISLVACATTVTSQKVPGQVLEKASQPDPQGTSKSTLEQDLEKSSATVLASGSAEQQPSAQSNAADSSPSVICNESGTQAEMNVCAHEDYKTADAELNQAYQSLRSQLSASGKQSLETAEGAWLSFRDLDCTFARGQFEGGSIEPMIYSGCLGAQTANRTQELQQPAAPQTSYAEADAQLNRAYQSVRGVISEVRKSELTEVQLAWLEYRDYNCAFEVDYRSTVKDKNQCLARMSETRSAQLQADFEQNNM
ncbi:MAG: lysozyme inhibitor LprI family protein [Phormidesmis sp.]